MDDLRCCCFLLLLLFFNNFAPCNGSLFCPHTAYPSSEADFEQLRVEVQVQQQEDDPIQLGQPIYRLKRGRGGDGIKRTADDHQFRAISGERPFRLFTAAHSAECPKRGCLHEMALAEPRVPGTLFYHTDTIMGKLIPPGFLTVDASPRLYCAIVRDDCGASVPIYRHFKMVGPRVYYAYSTQSDLEIGANFTRESMPMCFGWAVERPVDGQQQRMPSKEEQKEEEEEEAAAILLKNSEKKERDEGGKGGGSAEEEEEAGEKDGEGEHGEEGGQCSVRTAFEGGNRTTEEQEKAMREEGILVNGFAVLTAYDNQKLGTLRDHFYTTRKQPTAAGDGEYKKEADLGLVLVDPAQSNCSAQCLLKMGQMLANRSDGLGGIFPLRDHKLVLMGKESGDTYYAPTGEHFYCAKRAGQCGAQLALRRYWHLVEMDSLLTVNTSSASAVPVFSIPTWDGPICYIWTMPNN